MLPALIMAGVILLIIGFMIWIVNKAFNFTPKNIFEAVRHFKYDFINDYIEKGGDLNVKNIAGMTPLMILCDKGIKAKKGPHSSKFALDIKNIGPLFETIRLMEYLIEKGAKVNQRDNNGNSELFYAATSPEKIEVLLKAGTDINSINNAGETILIVAVRSGLYEVVKTFLKFNADIDIKDNLGKTAIEYAYENNFEATKELFIKKMGAYQDQQ
ncbi:MAG TPA: ankyrin repeat domain-containing protein [bacterium]|nr:ankyrin repeat domain-containing protein [bacterium]